MILRTQEDSGNGKKLVDMFKKGSKAFYIIGPVIKKIKEENEEKQILAGFKAIPVFRIENTEGEPIMRGIQGKYPL